MEKDLKIAVTDNNNGAELMERIKRRKDIQINEDVVMNQYRKLIRNDSLDLALVIDENFDKDILNGKTGNVEILYNSTNDSTIFKKLSKTILAYQKDILINRLDSLGANMQTITPIEIASRDVYTQQESFGKLIGGFLPYMFVLFCLMGAMYPAIDLFTGEKEKGTIETILSVPASRFQILFGKMLVVILSGVTSGLLTILGLYLALRLHADIPDFLKNVVLSILDPSSIGLVVLMLIPLTAFFAGILIPASIYAKSFKEAQSLIQPMVFIVIFPLIIGMMPGIKLTILTALIPVLNVALACREIIAGTIDYGLLLVVFLSLITFAILSLMVCVRWFGKEGNILRV